MPSKKCFSSRRIGSYTLRDLNSIALHIQYKEKEKHLIYSLPLGKIPLSFSKLDLCVDPMIGCYCILQLSKSFVLTSNRISKKHVSKSSFLPARKDHSYVFLTSGSDRFSFPGGFFSQVYTH